MAGTREPGAFAETISWRNLAQQSLVDGVRTGPIQSADFPVADQRASLISGFLQSEQT